MTDCYAIDALARRRLRRMLARLVHGACAPVLTGLLITGMLASGALLETVAGGSWHARLARHWAPVIFQDVDLGSDNPQGRYDLLALADFDGDTDAGNNWEHADLRWRDAHPLKPYVYYSVIETQTHYFITYSLFHPRDWRWYALSGAGPFLPPDATLPLTHENDLESATLVVLKDAGLGKLRLMGTVCHYQNYCFAGDEDVAPQDWALDAGNGPARVVRDGGRPCLFVESGGHGIGGLGRALSQEEGGPVVLEGGRYAFKSECGIIYTCAENYAYVPTDEPVPGGNGTVLGCVYQLAPLDETLWPLRHEMGPGKMFEGPFEYVSTSGCRLDSLPRYLTASGQDGGANPPWARNALGDDLERGAWFLEPARALDHYVAWWYDSGLPGYSTYIWNPYLTVETALEVAAPEGSRLSGYPVRLAWEVSGHDRDLAGQVQIYLSRTGGRTWSHLPLYEGRVNDGECIVDLDGPGADGCILAVRAPLACDEHALVVGLTPAFTLIDAGERLAWTKLTDITSMTPARAKATAVYDPVGDRLLVWGGFAGESLSGLWAFDMVDLAWEWVDRAAPESPPARHSHVAVYDGASRTVIMHGGENDAILGDLWVTRPAAGNWECLAVEGELARSGHVGGLDDRRGRLVVFGGWNGDTVCGDVWSLETQAAGSWERVESGGGPGGRFYAAGVMDEVGDRLIIHGGFSDRACSIPHADTWAFHLESRIWELLHDGSGVCPPARGGHGAALDAAGGCLIVATGSDGSASFADTWSLDLETQEWVQSQAVGLPAPRSHAAFARRSRGDQMLLVGGFVDGAPDFDVWSMVLAAGPRGREAEPATGGDIESIIPARVWPNPASGGVSITFAADRARHVDVAIYDVRGKLVRRIFSGRPGPPRVFYWDGRDGDGDHAASGVYMCRIGSDRGSRVMPVVLAR